MNEEVFNYEVEIIPWWAILLEGIAAAILGLVATIFNMLDLCSSREYMWIVDFYLYLNVIIWFGAVAVCVIIVVGWLLLWPIVDNCCPSLFDTLHNIFCPMCGSGQREPQNDEVQYENEFGHYVDEALEVDDEELVDIDTHNVIIKENGTISG